MLKNTETWKSAKKPFTVSGYILVFLMCFPLILDWNQTSLKGKCRKVTLKLSEGSKKDFFHGNVFEIWINYINLETVTTRKSQKNSQFGGFYWRSSDFFWHTFMHISSIEKCGYMSFALISAFFCSVTAFNSTKNIHWKHTHQ